MKTLYLMRHAKSTSHGGGLKSDHNRPLNDRGRAAANLVGAYMAAHGMIPERILCSDAARTCETLELLLPHLTPDIPNELRSDIYLAGPPALLKLVRGLPDAISAAMILGHNPGIESLTHTFADTGRDSDALIGLEQKFPTAALAVLTFDMDRWKEAGPGAAKLIDFVVPRKLGPDATTAAAST